MKKAITWTPRIMGILFALFPSLFAFDVFDGSESIWRQILGFLIHLLPVYFLIAGVWLGWKHPLLGGLIFLGFALWYAVTFLNAARGLDSTAMYIFALLPAIIGMLFLAGWWPGRAPNVSAGLM